MLDLKDAVPVDAFTPMFSEVRERVIATNVDQFLKNCPGKVPSVSLFMWDEMVHRGVTKTPFKIAPIINNEFKGIYQFIQKELKAEPIRDVYAVKYYNEVQPNDAFAEIVLAQCFPEDIHIVDVEFSNNTNRVAKDDPTRKFRNYHGLHVFDNFIEKLKNVARYKDAKRLSLMVAHPPLYEVFSKHGFKVSDTVMAQKSHAMAKQGFSMYLTIK